MLASRRHHCCKHIMYRLMLLDRHVLFSLSQTHAHPHAIPTKYTYIYMHECYILLFLQTLAVRMSVLPIRVYAAFIIMLEGCWWCAVHVCSFRSQHSFYEQIHKRRNVATHHLVLTAGTSRQDKPPAHCGAGALLHSTLNSTQLSSTPASTGWMYADRHSRRKYRHRDEPLSRSTMHRQLPQFALRMRERWGSMWSCLQAVFSGEFTHVVSNYICTYVLSYLHTIFCNKIASTTD